MQYFWKQFSMVSSKPQHASLCWRLELFFYSGMKSNFPLVSLWSNATGITQRFKRLMSSINFLIMGNHTFSSVKYFWYRTDWGEIQWGNSKLLYLIWNNTLSILTNGFVSIASSTHYQLGSAIWFVTDKTCPIKNFSLSAVVIKSNYWVLTWKDEACKNA